MHADDDRLLEAISALSSVRDLDGVTAIVRRAARELTHADGVTFVLKDAGQCYYADEDAIAPLWKGRRFPLESCISGWVMLHGQPVAIRDIYADPRIPHDAYRPTFVKSLLMVPVRTEDPVAAIGAYWSREHEATVGERGVLEALARAAALALMNVQLWTELESALTAERQARLEAEAATREATKANLLKDQFLAMVSHELRTPLNVMQGWIWQLRRKATPARQEKALDVLDRNIALQCRLVEDLLDVSRGTAGLLQIEPQLTDLAAVARPVVDVSQSEAEDRGIVLTFDVRGASPALVMGDPDRLQQVLSNVIANAIKFTPRGGVVEVVVERVENTSRVTVRDSGVGVSSEFLPHIFDRFRQEDATVARPFGGLGIGLTIVKQLVALHGGTVSAHSAGKDQGTTICVELPVPAVLSRPVEELGISAPDRDGTVSLKGLTVLVLDDEPQAGRAVRDVLEEHEATVYVAASADEALAVVERVRPNVVLADLAMPGTDGFSFLRRFRARLGPAPHVPVAALSGLSSDRYAERSKAAGFELFLQKPIAPVALAQSLARLAGRSDEQVPS